MIGFFIVFNIMLHIISLANSACQSHSSIEDSTLCLPRIPVFIEFRRHYLPSSLGRQRRLCKSWMLIELTWLMKESWMEPVLTELTRLPKEDCRNVVLTEFTWLTQEDCFKISVRWAGSAKEEFSYVDLIKVFDWF